MKTIDSDMKLDGFRLRDALESIYHAFANNLLGRGASASPALFMRDIPEMVLDVAIGAGWVPLSENPFDTKVGTTKGDVVWEADFKITDKTKLPEWVREHIREVESLPPEQREEKGLPPPPISTIFTKNQAQRIVQFGGCYVERTFLNSFYDLLSEPISFHLGEGTLHEERLKSLPAVTTARQREKLLKDYIKKQKQKNMSAKKTDIAKLADVDYSVFMKWQKGDTIKKGRIVDSLPSAQRISMLLRFDEQVKKRPYRRAATH
jgi:hypothetical protein